MFHKCKNREEINRIYERMKKLLINDVDLLNILNESYEIEINHVVFQFLDDSKGKFKRTNHNLHNDDWRVMELFEEMVFYKNEYPEYNGHEFLDSVMKFCDDKEFVTQKQYNKLLEIYYRNNMQNMEAFS